MPQNKFWDFLCKQPIAQDLEAPNKNSQDAGSLGNEEPQEVDLNAKGTTIGIKVSEKDELSLISTSDGSSEEWTRGMKGTLCSAGYFIFGSFVLIFFMNFTNERMPRGLDPLPDVGHELIPKMRPEKLGDVTQVFLIILFWVSTIWLRERKNRVPIVTWFLTFMENSPLGKIPLLRSLKGEGNRWPIITKFFLTLGNLYMIRSMSVYVTSVPATDNHCRYEYQDIPNIWMNTLKGIISLGSSNIHCGDLMFSGHTCMVTTIWLALNRNCRNNYPIRIVSTILWLMTFIFIIGTRSHYTIDIWIALWLTIFVEAWTPSYFPFTKQNMKRFINSWVYGNEAKEAN